MQYETYIGIDYSGAGTPEKRSKSIQVYNCGRDSEPAPVVSPATSESRARHWNRNEVAHWLIDRLQRDDRCIIGVDHAFSFPIAYFRRYKIDSWPAFLEDFARHWPTHQPNTTVDQFRKNSKRMGKPEEFRLTEKWTSSAKSVFQFDVQGSVAKSTHAGLPFLQMICKQVNRLHVWPLDGWEIPADSSVIFETYPSLFRNRYLREARTVDQQDAYAVSRWLRDMDRLGSLDKFSHPPLTEEQKKIAGFEGWIFGVY